MPAGIRLDETAAQPRSCFRVNLMDLNFRIIETRLGPVGFVMDNQGLRRVYLPQGDGDSLRTAMHAEFPAAVEADDLAPRLAEQLGRYFAGEPVEFDTPLSLDWTGATDFLRAVWTACYRIPYGRTATYGDLARRVGRPGAARAVGTAMRRNPCPIVIPCHRILGCGGKVGGYSGPGGVEFKQRLLEMESKPASAL